MRGIAVGVVAYLPFGLALASWTDLPLWQYLAVGVLAGAAGGVTAAAS
jgi:hypothetical protein